MQYFFSREKTMQNEKIEVTCPLCQSVFMRCKEREQLRPLLFCAYCGSLLHATTSTEKKSKQDALFVSLALPNEKEPTPDQVISTIDHYRVLKSIGKGGMGEVFLAYDTICGRKVALKRIRSDLMSHLQLQRRFLREARITSQLTHPTIVPIYSIHIDSSYIYYTMPYVDGETLHTILKTIKRSEQIKNAPPHPHSSIPSLVRIFLQVCHACAYAHAQGVLHRDLKPENFIIGPYGQVLILDWGLAKIFEETEEPIIQDQDAPSLNQITKLGKVVGTIAYMAPERALEQPASVQTDIYSLGVILYQILSLSLPFMRKNLKQFKQQLEHEHYVPPEIVAPYREVPLVLSEITKRCLAFNPKERFSSVSELISAIEKYLEGTSQWLFTDKLSLENKNDWQFQENILLADHIAITSPLNTSDWMTLSLSKEAFANSLRLETKVHIKKNCHGIGFLFSTPEGLENGRIKEGYCLWLSSEIEPSRKTKLLRSSIAVLEAPEIILEMDKTYAILIEKIDRHIHLYIDGVLQFSYVSHIPVIGPHIGVLSKDYNFDLSPLIISSGSQNITIGCLAVPDAFLANKNYELALTEYRRIGAAFPGRTEGREALFRAGITLIEKAKALKEDAILQQAYSEFEKLEKTSGAPLSLLGKALIYSLQKDYIEELKCFELALRKYKKHPLISIVEKELLFRIHESAREDRKSAYAFILLGLRFLPQMLQLESMKRLLNRLESSWERPWFMLHTINPEHCYRESIAIHLAFWLAKPHLIRETIADLMQQPQIPMDIIADALFALAELGDTKGANETLHTIKETLSPNELKRLHNTLYPFHYLLHPTTAEGLRYALSHPNEEKDRLLVALMRSTITENNFDIVLPFLDLITQRKSPWVLATAIEGLLYTNDVAAASSIINAHPATPTSPLFFYHYLITQQMPASIPPKSYTLVFSYLKGELPAHVAERTFLWERRILYSHLALYYRSDVEKSQAFRMLARAQTV